MTSSATGAFDVAVPWAPGGTGTSSPAWLGPAWGAAVRARRHSERHDGLFGRGRADMYGSQSERETKGAGLTLARTPSARLPRDFALGRLEALGGHRQLHGSPGAAALRSHEGRAGIATDRSVNSSTTSPPRMTAARSIINQYPALQQLSSKFGARAKPRFEERASAVWGSGELRLEHLHPIHTGVYGKGYRIINLTSTRSQRRYHAAALSGPIYCTRGAPRGTHGHACNRHADREAFAIAHAGFTPHGAKCRRATLGLSHSPVTYVHTAL